jgi:hypothetical protein
MVSAIKNVLAFLAVAISLKISLVLLEEGRRKKEEGRRKKEEGRRKKEEGRSSNSNGFSD